MPPEIADSDAESEDLVNEVEDNPPTAINSLSNGTDFPPQIDFEEFLDPTQRLSEFSPSQNALLSLGTGSTEKLLRGLDNARKGLLSSSPKDLVKSGSPTRPDTESDSSPTMPRKRGHSAVETSVAGESSTNSNNKRAKTYSNKSKNATTLSSDLFADIRLSCAQSDLPSVNCETPDEPQTAPMVPPDIQPVARERDRPRRTVSLLRPLDANASHQVSTSMSSMGGYESINLDFRGSRDGLHTSANPFVDSSQISVDAEGVHMSQVENLHGNDEISTTIAPAETVLSTGTFEQDMMTSPARPTDPIKEPTIDPLALAVDPMQEIFHETERPSKRRRTDLGGTRATASPAPTSRRALSVSPESVCNGSDASIAKKRGRKFKSSKLTDSSPAPEIAQEMVSHAMDPPPSPARRSRGGTLDSSSQVSQSSEAVSNTKRKRKKTKIEEIKEQSSPVKDPSSELNLSDEQLIGLPKEQYKPRPSRSRSKQSVDEEASQMNGPEAEVQHDHTVQKPLVEIETPKLTQGKGKGKKSKVKRAKTSAAALKKSEAMFSEGEDDVLYMDEKPVAVKLDLPPDLKVLKGEETAEADLAFDGENEVKTAGRSNKNISIEIPAAIEDDGTVHTDPSKKISIQPKKRGRKPKQPTPAAPTPEPLTENEDNGGQSPEKPTHENLGQGNATPTRQALTEKTPNIAAPSIPAPTPEETTISSTRKGKENISPTHSPLKASSLKMNSRYRVGLSSKTSIPSLLRRVDKTKKAPTKVSTTVKEKKVKAGDVGEGEDEDEGDGQVRLGLRDKNGELIEWEF